MFKYLSILHLFSSTFALIEEECVLWLAEVVTDVLLGGGELAVWIGGRLLRLGL